MTELVKFSVSDAAIAELSKKYMSLKVHGLEDRDGLAAVHSARMEVKNLRVDVEKTRKKLKEASLEYGRKVDAEAKRLTINLGKIESHLEAEESIVAVEKERLRQEELDRQQAILDGRLKLLAECETMANPVTVAAMSADDFASFLSDSQVKHLAKVQAEAEANKKRLAAEAAAKEEAEKLAAERAELAKQRAEQEAEAKRVREEQAAAQKAIDDEKRRLAKIEEDRLRAIELEKAKAEAAEKARVETEQRIAREKAAAIEAERLAKAEAEIRAAAEEAERVRREALRPDVEKLQSVALAVEDIDVPNVSEDAQAAAKAVRKVLLDATRKIHNIASELAAKKEELVPA